MIKKILALLETKFPGARKDALLNLASVIALQADTEDEVTEIVPPCSYLVLSYQSYSFGH